MASMIRALASRANCRALLSGKKAPSIIYSVQSFGTTSDGDKKSNSKKAKEIVPDEFFDEKVESEKEFLDVAASLVNSSGLEALTTVKDRVTWDMIDGSGGGDSSINRRAMPISAAAETSKNIKQISSGADLSASSSSVDEIEDQTTRFHESLEKRIGEDLLTQTSVTDIISNPDVAEHLEGFRPKSLHLPVEYMNYTVPWRKTDEFPHQMLDRFVPDTSDARYRHDRQGLRACPGKLQRRGKEGRLGCHLIDLDALNYLDVLTLRRFLSDDSEILGRKHTGLCAKCQRQVAKAIKRARNFGIVPHLGQFIVQDSRPTHRDQFYHDAVGASGEGAGGRGTANGSADQVSGLKESKTII